VSPPSEAQPIADVRAGSGAVLRWPVADVLETTRIGEYVRWLSGERGVEVADYQALWRWSTDAPDAFWRSIWDFFEVESEGRPTAVRGPGDAPGGEWFPGATLNYAAHLLRWRHTGDDSTIAVIGRSQSRPDIAMTIAALRDQVARASVGLQRLGVGRGDRVVGYLPNLPETLVAFLATASLGAVWASCSPEFGVRAVVDRFGQLEPKVLLAVSAYTYGDKHVDRSNELLEIRRGLPSLEHVVHVPLIDHDAPLRAVAWNELLSRDAELEFDAVPFDHPLYVLFSSGTTGIPKAIVHGHGGILLEHLKHIGLHWDTRPGDRVLWYTTTAWTMWNMLVSALLHDAAIVLHDGNPLWPDLAAQWNDAASTGATLLGTSPAYVMACRKQQIHPSDGRDLGPLRTVGITGAPLPPDGFDWIVDELGPSVLVNSVSGGTDVCSGFVGANPWSPVYRGELSAPCLGVDVAAFDASGRPVVGERGELVVRAPMPSMPIRFWGDDEDTRYRASYFDMYPGIWRHGDWVEFSDRGSCVISGRSDATLNRGGVRLGTAEFYAVVDDLPEVGDSVVVHLEDPSGATPGELLLFVSPANDAVIDGVVIGRIRAALRLQLSPRHVPDSVEVVARLPRTLTGKRVEAPIKRILRGEPADRVVSRESLDHPDALDDFVAIVSDRRPT
jgi:acetoacetyl-CoA synthetase